MHPRISGDCGKNVKYSFDDNNGNLTISGSGPMANYNDYSYFAPWKQYSNRIKSAVIDEGVTTIGTFAFYECSSLTKITIHESVKSIGNSAFSGCSKLEHQLNKSLSIEEIPSGILTELNFEQPLNAL